MEANQYQRLFNALIDAGKYPAEYSIVFWEPPSFVTGTVRESMIEAHKIRLRQYKSSMSKIYAYLDTYYLDRNHNNLSRIIRAWLLILKKVPIEYIEHSYEWRYLGYNIDWDRIKDSVMAFDAVLSRPKDQRINRFIQFKMTLA